MVKSIAVTLLNNSNVLMIHIQSQLEILSEEEKASLSSFLHPTLMNLRIDAQKIGTQLVLLTNY